MSHLNKFKIVAFIILFVLAAQNANAEKKFEISADNISYGKNNETIQASGSVEVVYGDISLESEKIFNNKSYIRADGNVKITRNGTSLDGNSITFFKDTDRVFAKNGYHLTRKDLDIKGSLLDYSLTQDTGTSEDVLISFGSTWISGQYVDLGKNVISLKNASFSTCDQEHPHYKISSLGMYYYQDSGWIVEYLGLLWVNGFPVFPVPTYVYDTGVISGAYRKKNPMPLPEIGSNNEDGFYFNEKFIWRTTSYSYGMLAMNYKSKKGLGLGFEGNYLLSDFNEGSLRIYGLNQDGYYGGVSHTTYFGDEIKTEDKKSLLYEVLKVAPKKKYSAETNFSFREWINFERVSQTPVFKLNYMDVPFSFLNFTPHAEISAGYVSEESSGVNLLKSNINSSLDYLHPISEKDYIKTGMDLSYSTYAYQGNWGRILGRTDYVKQLTGNASASIGYSHFFVNDGSSPFRYENYRFYPEDELRSFIKIKNDSFSFSIDYSYNVPSFVPRDIDYSIAIGMHCYDATISYRAVRGELLFGVMLVSQ